MRDARQWIDHLRLVPHPEGGWFRETYRSAEGVAREHLPGRFTGDRAFSTAIYYLLQGEEFSALHEIKQDEAWHFYDGSPLTVHVIEPDGRYSALKLGRDPDKGEQPQGVVLAGCLFGATVAERNSFSLVGCTVAPGFDFADFTMPTREELLGRHRRHRELIERLTRLSASPRP